MAKETSKKIVVPQGGNSGEIKRLRDEIEKAENIRQRMNDEIAAKDREISILKSENARLGNSLNVCYDKIKVLEEGANREQQGLDSVKDGYVTIASCPLPDGTKPIRIIVDGITVPRNVDEDGVCYEDLPIAKAVAILSEGSGFTRYLIGPANSIKGIVRKGMYNVEVVFHKHAKKREAPGKYEFVRVLSADQQNPKG